MAYIHVLAFVLCSCFLQVAFSTTETTFKRTVTRKRSVPVTPPTPPPPKYPNLAKAKEMFWSSWEDINKSTEFGKLNTRAAKNVFAALLNSAEMWSTLQSIVQSRVKLTNDKRRADAQVNGCNMLTQTLTTQTMPEGYLALANDAYDALSEVELELPIDALQVIIDLVNDGQMSQGLDALRSVIAHIDLDPMLVSKWFGILKKNINKGGIINLNNNFGRRLMTVSSKLK